MKNKSTITLSLVAGVLVVLSYITFTAVSWAQFPLPFSPVQNWLSDLGNPLVNPGGAIFYNLGLELTAAWVLIFFLGLIEFRIKGNRLQNIMLILTVVFGAIGAFGMVMTTIFPISQPAQHSFWSMINRICTGTGFAFSVAAFRYYRGFSRWLLGLGVVATLVNFLVSVFWNKIFLVEWVIISFWLLYCLLLGIATQQLKTKSVEVSAA